MRPWQHLAISDNLNLLGGIGFEHQRENKHNKDKHGY
jgi:hypothetical protein